jgi:ABC-2 type transport system permease protein
MTQIATNLPTADRLTWSESRSSQGFASFLQETFALMRRLFIQLWRRPTTLVAGTIQPLMWLILFGALFQNAPTGLFGTEMSYDRFLGAGVIAFTAFSSALNAGLPVMFDREFGFLDRLLVAPLTSRYSIVAASAAYMVVLSLVQTAAIVIVSAFLGSGWPDLAATGLLATIVTVLVIGVTAISLGLTFALPGHIELLAAIFIVNLPLLFASTALAPLNFMPVWLRWIACFNPLSYAIEPIRYVFSHPHWHWQDTIIEAPWGNVSIAIAVSILVGFAVVASVGIQPLLKRRLS